MKLADIIGGVVGILIGLYVVLTCRTFPADVVMKIGPGFFPSILGYGIIIFSSLLLIQALLGKAAGEYEPFDIKSKGTQRVIISIVVLVIYSLLFEPLGFILTTMLIIMFFMYLLENRDLVQFIWVPLAITLGVYLVFAKILNLTLPNGVLSFLFDFFNI